MLANRLTANNNPKLPCPWVDPAELQRFKSTTHIVRFLTTAIHELLGHGTGKLLSETAPSVYNFDKNDLPVSPLTQKAVTSYYSPSQTWGSVFGKLAGTVEECRAILVSEYLMDNKELLAIFGYTDTSDITADERKQTLVFSYCFVFTNQNSSLCNIRQHWRRRATGSAALQL